MTKKSKKNKEKNEKVHYEEGDLVGAKVKGYPVWPGYIEKVVHIGNKAKYNVRFFGTNDTSQLTEACLKLFTDFTTKEKACSFKGFKNALEICQEKYDALLADKKEGKSSTPELSPSESPNPDAGSLVIKEEQDNIRKVETKSKRARSIKQPPPITLERTDTDGVKQSPPAPEVPNSPKAEGENRQNRAIAKLREKLDRKIAEKEARKIELKKMRQSEKACKVLVVVNKNLSRLLQTLEKVRGNRSVVQSNPLEWNITVRKYSTALSILGKCIGKHYFRENPKVDPYEYRQAREILIAMIREIKRVQLSDDIPLSVRNEVSKLKQMAKNASDVKKFINQNMDSKTAMIERKENDAK